MASLIDQRLAAAAHLRQIETLARVERMASRLETIVEQQFRMALRDAQDRGLTYQQTLDEIPPKLVAAMTAEMTRLIASTHRATVVSYASMIPRRWFVSLVPELAILGPQALETTLEMGMGSLIEKIMRLFRRLTPPSKEPVTAGRLPDAEWLQIVREFIFPPPTAIEISTMLERPDSNTGVSWQERLRGLSKLFVSARGVLNEVVSGFAEAENISQIAKRLEPMVQGVKHSARRIARTEGMRVAEQVQRRTWDQFGDMQIGAQLIEVMDERTRPTHRLRNGTVYYKNGTPPLSEMPDLPDAPNCRGQSVPVLRPPEGIDDDPVLKAAFANNQGDGIPDPATYDGWFKNADPQRRKLAVGVGRYRDMEKALGGSREPEWTDFIDAEGKLLPRRQLQTEAPHDRDQRKTNVQKTINDRAELLRQVSSFGFLTG